MNISSDNRQRQTVYESKVRFQGPLLLKKSDLIELDSIIQNISSTMQAYVASETAGPLATIEQEVVAKIQSAKAADDYENQTKEKKEALDKKYSDIKNTHRWYEREQCEKREVKISLEIKTEGKRFPNFTSLSQASKSPELDKEIDTFEYNITTGDYSHPKLKIECSKESDNSISIEGRPDEHAIIEDTFPELKAWAQKNAPPKWVSIWSNAGGLISFLGIMILLTALGSLTSLDRVPSKLAMEMNDTLKDGITDKNMHKAIELVLRHASGESMQTLSQSAPKFITTGTYFIVFLIVFGLIKPNQGVIDLKGHSKVLRFWNFWIKFVSYSAPTFLVIYLVTKLMDHQLQ